jgi:CO/xanthine dehydrogenase Mo-binding subunit
VLKQILAEALGLNMADVRLTAADTAMTPQADLGTWGSRVTLMAGNAVLDAAKKIKKGWPVLFRPASTSTSSSISNLPTGGYLRQASRTGA